MPRSTLGSVWLAARFQPPQGNLALAVFHARRYLFTMKVAEIKDLVERRPFRPFAVRLNNGAQYTFKDARDVGAPKDYRLLIYFGKSEAVRIDTDSIAEIFER
jgi:hypothetical protein